MVNTVKHYAANDVAVPGKKHNIREDKLLQMVLNCVITYGMNKVFVYWSLGR